MARRSQITAGTLAQLVDDHAAALGLFARQWCDCPEDVVQEAFVKLAAARKPPDRPLPWLYRVVRNGALNAARAAKRRRRRESHVAQLRPIWFEPIHEDALDAQAAAAAMQDLPPELREVLVARIWGDLTFEEIGRVTGCRSSTAHRRYTAALEALRERLGSCTQNDATA